MSARLRVFQGILGTLNQKMAFLTLGKRLGNPFIFLVDSKEERGALQVLLKGLLLLAHCSARCFYGPAQCPQMPSFWLS
jgi:hypothetical protein